MRPRIVFGRFLISLGNLIKSLAVAVMKPDDLVEFGRLSYADPGNIASFSPGDDEEPGLSLDEQTLLEKVPIRSGRLLILGVGGGREAIPLARMGFEVTGVDFVPQLAAMARTRAQHRGLRIKTLVQEISKLDFPPRSFDLVWLSTGLYSSVPTRKRRVTMLKKIENILEPGGNFLLQFHWNHKKKLSNKKAFFKKVFGILSLGNFHYETGDMLWRDSEFIHAFSSEDSLRREFEQSGLEIVYLDIPANKVRGGALLKKK